MNPFSSNQSSSDIIGKKIRIVETIYPAYQQYVDQTGKVIAIDESGALIVKLDYSSDTIGLIPKIDFYEIIEEVQDTTKSILLSNTFSKKRMIQSDWPTPKNLDPTQQDPTSDASKAVYLKQADSSESLKNIAKDLIKSIVNHINSQDDDLDKKQFNKDNFPDFESLMYKLSKDFSSSTHIKDLKYPND